MRAGHFMGEHMPTIHASLCRHLSRCGAGNTTGLHLLFDKPGFFSWPRFVDDAIACLSESRHVSGGGAAVAGWLGRQQWRGGWGGSRAVLCCSSRMGCLHPSVRLKSCACLHPADCGAPGWNYAVLPAMNSLHGK